MSALWLVLGLLPVGCLFSARLDRAKGALSCQLGPWRPAGRSRLRPTLPPRARETARHVATAPRRCHISARGFPLPCAWRSRPGLSHLACPPCQGGAVCHWPCEGRLAFHPILRDHSWPLFMPVISVKARPLAFRLSAQVGAPRPLFLGPGGMLGSRRSGPSRAEQLGHFLPGWLALLPRFLRTSCFFS